MLLDTHVLLWHERGDRRLGAKARRSIEGALQERAAAVSSISFWEIGMRIQKGRLEFLQDLDAWRRELLDDGLIEIPVDGGIAARAGLLADMHGDPADRLIVATALQGYQLVTADWRILDWPGQLSRLDATE
ncbi:MAG: type II toxin-antitoxin system VapC family toxin [Gammaproteobacteria bacterium]|nr:type II toxin-antitoxin system VapC family toxin [Gammaproteobacteria bacterium]MDE0413347.1 type II toxin-antitoxin system VapC family toxin [Gammaproteobacteria bacterium]